jgi:hypothetical protein
MNERQRLREKEQWALDLMAQTERATCAEAEVARLRAVLDTAGAGLAATYALLQRLGRDEDADACLTMIQQIDDALARMSVVE